MRWKVVEFGIFGFVLEVSGEGECLLKRYFNDVRSTEIEVDECG